MRDSLSLEGPSDLHMQEQQAYLAAIIASSDDAIISKSLDGIITSWNPAAEHIYGYKASEAIGQSITIIIPPGLWEEEKDILNKLRHGQKIDHFQTIRQSKDGRLVQVSQTISPIRDKSGRVIGASKIARDITRQKEMEREVIAQYEWYKVTLASIGDSVIATDTGGKVTFLNRQAEKIIGWSNREALGQPLEKVFPIVSEETRQPAGNPVAKVIKGGKIEGLANHTVLIARDGAEHVIEDSAAPIKMPDGSLIGVVLVFHSVNSQKRLEKELKDKADMLMEKDRRKDEFLAMLAHELRNPLAPISNALRIMESKAAAPYIQEEAIHMANRQVNHMVRLLDDLLDVSRITHGKFAIHHDRIDLCDAIQVAIASVKAKIDEQRQTLKIQIPDCPIWIGGDGVRLAQLLGNLLNNASKYTPRGGHIVLDFHQEGTEAVIRVRDNGIGIAPDKLPRIFDMFMQADNAMERTQGGLGIGLMLVKNIAELHGGSVEAYSEGRNKGSEFVVRLPITTQPEQEAERETAQQQATPQHLHSRVLIVDDNEASARTLGWMVEILGHEVKLAYNGPSAIEIAHHYRPDVVLLDIGLPGMDGYKVCRAMCKDPALKETVFIAQTGWGQEQHLVRSKQAGFDYHLIKPVSLEALQEQLEKIGERAHI